MEEALLDYLDVDVALPELDSDYGCSDCRTNLDTVRVLNHTDYNGVVEAMSTADTILKQREDIKKIRQKIRHLRKEMKNHYGQPVVYLSIDVETWERNHDKVTEIGWTVKYFNPPQPIHSNHFVIRENIDYYNGIYVPNAKFDFNFGNSKIASLDYVIAELNQKLDNWRDKDYRIFIVCHDPRKDKEWLLNAGLDMRSCKIIDTQVVFYGITGTVPRIGLSNMLRSINITFSNLHNAGNDARYTLNAFLKMVINPLPPLPSLPNLNDLEGMRTWMESRRMRVTRPPPASVDSIVHFSGYCEVVPA
ncbi:hypothetical protein BKA69DRAFT_611220 [Paraphysoderma sedebokerense]|nr:hypothetical protein BKA69DRAFT_611220 [Paraphysoderma sedebokerense]